jgi:chromosomal replication initiator protein
MIPTVVSPPTNTTLADDLSVVAQRYWMKFKEEIKAATAPLQFATWIQPLEFRALEQLDVSKHKLIIEAPNRFKLSWAIENLLPTLEDWWAANTTIKASIELSLPPTEQALSQSNVERMQTQGVLTQSGHPPNILAESKLQIAVEPRALSETRLNPAWTFDAFVPGKANQLARAAAFQVAENPGHGYNPLFLYGGVGLGKSHLIHSIGNSIIQRNPKAQIRYIHAETYVSDVVKAYQRKSFDDFKKYYYSLDLLLVDDIQFFAGKSRTQEEFFYAFEKFIADQKQLIITSDIYPTELNGIDMRLVSRFGSGLTVAIEPPEIEMRVAILIKKSTDVGYPLSEEEAFFVAKHLKSNVRELEGALRKIVAFCDFHQTKPNLSSVKEALKDILLLQKTAVSVETIQKYVADFYKIKIADMYSKKRPASIALPRQIAMYLAKELTQKSLPEIGELFGGRDHTTVLHAVRKITDTRNKNSDLNRDLHLLEQQIRS